MKKIFVSMTIVFLLIVSSVFALGMTAGTVRILVDVGSTSSSSFGLVNKENDTIIVKLRVEGDAAQFLEIPTTLELVPNKVTYVDVKANIPSNYDGSLGGTINGSIYAVQEGESGQVQINVQAKKAIQILISEYGGRLPEKTSESQVPAKEENLLITTGLASLVSFTTPLIIIVIVVVVLIVSIFVVLRRFEISIKPKREVKN
jgi:hypothetical protein